MSMRDLPRSAVTGAVKLTRLPLDIVVSLLPGHGTGTKPAAAIAVARCEATLRAPAGIALPLAAVDDLEDYEGMRVQFPQALVISEYFNYDRFGEIVLSLPPAGQDPPVTPPARSTSRPSSRTLPGHA